MSDLKETKPSAQEIQANRNTHVPAVYVNSAVRSMQKTISVGHADLNAPAASELTDSEVENHSPLEFLDPTDPKTSAKKSKMKERADLVLKAIRSEVRPLQIKKHLRALQSRIRKIV